MSIDFMTDPLIEVYDEPILTKNRIQGQWTGATVLPSGGELSSSFDFKKLTKKIIIIAVKWP